MTTAAQTAFPAATDVEGSWDWDKIHAPRPLSPLASDCVVMSMSEGFTIAQHDFGSSLALHCRMFGNYLYATFAPDPAFTPKTTDIDEYTRDLTRIAAGIGERWVNEWEPSLLPILERARTADYASMTDAQLQAAFEEQLKNQVYFWTIHGWINLSLVPATALMEFYKAEVKPQDPNEGWQLTQGYRTKSVDAGNGLWRLSRIVKASPALTTIFEQVEPQAMMDALEGSAEGRTFLVELRAYLDEFGWRSDGIYEIGDATWREEPAIPLNTIQGYLRLRDDDNPELALDKAAARREALAAGARAVLANDPAKLRQFAVLMDAAKHNLRVTEDHSFWIDQMGTATLRRFALAAGQRLAEKGVLERTNDVFLLYKHELREALAGRGEWKALVDQRRASMEASARIVPPDHIGAPTPPSDDPFFIALVDKMLGFLPVEPSTDPDVITGVAASPGTVQGTAKVVRSLLEASKLQQGDIMVCEMTVPTWVPLFATVSGIVADSGGILSHCAIVAREFRLPAVVGTHIGTAIIKDGMTVTVDGTKGRVRIDSRR
ncbi:MAG TPA: PEP-utilizing enzyme [Chloroflexota bacterium]|nr:PEP-utilizing enzyme [Chloroflexota bacterium]